VTRRRRFNAASDSRQFLVHLRDPGRKRLLRIESQDPPKLLISCEGFTAIDHLSSSINFWANARLEKQGVLIEEKSLKRNPEGYIRSIPHKTHIIGEAIFILPKPSDKTMLTLKLTGSYFVKTGDSISAPSLMISGKEYIEAEKIFYIKVIESVNK
jgi:hypothetical protein